MIVKLYGTPKSSYTRLVALIAKEKEVPYEFVPIDLLKREHKAPEYLLLHPFGQVPYINDDGFILYESRAIARYLIKKYPNQGTAGLIPTGITQEALFEQASSVEYFNFTSNVSALVGEKVTKKIRGGGEPDPAKIAEYLQKVEASLDAYEVILGKHRYLAGENLTLADLQHLPSGSKLFVAELGEVITKRPNVHRWWKEISERPAWQAVKDGA